MTMPPRLFRAVARWTDGRVEELTREPTWWHLANEATLPLRQSGVYMGHMGHGRLDRFVNGELVMVARIDIEEVIP